VGDRHADHLAGVVATGERRIGALDAQVDADLVRERMVSTLSAWFGAFALFLAAIGLYGSLSYAVAERTRETGIRIALGAGKGVVIWTILREVLQVVVIGLLAGLPAALLAARAIGGLLYGLRPFDPLIVMAVAIVIAVRLLHQVRTVRPGNHRDARLRRR